MIQRPPALDPAAALGHWRRSEPVRPVADAGLINLTYAVGEPPTAVLQWVSPVFDPRIHLDIDAATRHLEARGLLTPRLLPTAAGELWVDDPAAGCWRLMTWVPGRTVHRLADPGMAAAAGALVGRFHAALADFREPRRAPLRAVHVTPARMAELAAALAACDGHPLAAPTRELGAEILAAWASWDGELEQPDRLCHGDLKVSNIRFADDGRALCLIDLDTIEPMALASELGDALRSWCNPAGEDRPEESRLDVGLFAAATRAFLVHAPPLREVERQAIVPGVERIALELAARFATDAVRNLYFREDRARYPEPGAHNLLRARGQLRLARSVRASLVECEEALWLG